MSNTTFSLSQSSLPFNLASITSASFTTLLPSTTLTASETASSGTTCITCSGNTPVCNCKTGETCVLTSRTCLSCPAIQCITSPSSPSNKNSSSSNSGANLGVIIGPVIAGIVLIGMTLGGWWWWRRRRARDLRLLGFSSTNSLKSNNNTSSKRNTQNPYSPQQPPTFRLPSAGLTNPNRSPRPASMVSGVPADVNEGSGGADNYSFMANAYAVPGVGEYKPVAVSAGGEGEGEGIDSGGGGRGVTRRVYVGNGNINLDTYSETGRGQGGRENSSTSSFGNSDRNRRSADAGSTRDASGPGGGNRGIGLGNGDPFDDSRSIATSAGLSFGSTNVIPIAFVPSPPGADGLGFEGMSNGEQGRRISGVGGDGNRNGNGEGGYTAATRLEEARRNAFGMGGGGGGQGPMVDRAGRPIRPARDPGLDLRINAAAANRDLLTGGSGSGSQSEVLANLEQMSREREREEEEMGLGKDNPRNSTYTGKSVAPSFFSGQSEAPMIMTSKQVQIGARRQAAEIVNLADAAGRMVMMDPEQGQGQGAGSGSGPGRNLTINTTLTEKAKKHQLNKSKVVLTPTQDTPVIIHRPGSFDSEGSGGTDPFGDHHRSGPAGAGAGVGLQSHPLQSGNSLGQGSTTDLDRLRAAIRPQGSNGTFGTGENYDEEKMSFMTGQATGGRSPVSERFAVDRGNRAPVNSQYSGGTTLEPRDSVSSFGTGRGYTGSAVVQEARKVQLGPGGSDGMNWQRSRDQPESEILASSQNTAKTVPPPGAFSNSEGGRSTDGHQQVGGNRESMLSTKSFADSLLGSFPMILSNSASSDATALPYAGATHQRMPTGFSSNTVNSSSSSRPLLPALTTNPTTSDSPLKMVTASSGVDSAISAFPRTAIPPPPTSRPPTRPPSSSESSSEGATSRPGRNTMGLSMASEGSGLQGFDFKF